MNGSLDGDFNLNSWSVAEYRTPATVIEGAAIPTVNFSRDLKAQERIPEWLFGKPGEFARPGFAGVPFRGNYSSISVTNYELSGTLTHWFNLANVTRTIKPRSGTMAQVLEATLTDLGFSTAGMTVIHSGNVTMAGGSGNAWVLLNEFLAAHGVAMLLGSIISVGDPRMLPLGEFDYHSTSSSVSVDQGNPAKYIDVNYYNHAPIVNGEVYPENILEAPVLQAEAGEVVEEELQLTGWLRSVNQPTCVSFVSATQNFYDGTVGVYSVASADGLPITPAQWAGTGGWLKLELTDGLMW